MCEPLMAGGVHHQFAVGVALQNTALKIEAARRLFQARGGADPQAGAPEAGRACPRVSPAGVAPADRR